MKYENIIVAILLVLVGAVAGSHIYERNSIDHPQNETDCELFFDGIAQNFKEPQFCERISPQALDVQGSFNGPPLGYQISYPRSKCFFAVAVETKNAKLCENVKTISTSDLDGSYWSADNCKSYVAGGQDWRDAAPSPYGLSKFMQDLGYSNQTLLLAQAGSSDASSSFNPVNFNSAIYDLFKSIRSNPDFMAKVKQLSSYNEPLSASSTRTPNEYEYLYYAVATSVNKPNLCEKISPNAYILYPNMVSNYDNSLRDECYHDVAAGFRKAAICNDITLRNLFTLYITSSSYVSPPTGHAYTVMLNNVDACKADVFMAEHPYGVLPPTSTPVDRNSEYPGGANNFIKVLGELGYQPSSTEANPANSYSWDDYLSYLRFYAPTSSRMDFLNRVQNYSCK